MHYKWQKRVCFQYVREGHQREKRSAGTPAAPANDTSVATAVPRPAVVVVPASAAVEVPASEAVEVPACGAVEVLVSEVCRCCSMHHGCCARLTC